MATRPTKSDLADSVQIALDAADTATGVTEEFNSIKEQFEVVNIQAKRIHQSCLLYTSPSPRDRQKSRMPSSA